MARLPLVAALLVACGSHPTPGPTAPAVAASPAAAGPVAAPPAGPSSPAALPPTPLADAHRDVARRIIEAARRDRGAWLKLAHLTDRIGARPSGSPALEQAVAWAVRAMKADGHANVVAEPVDVPHWQRGHERGALEAPIRRPLHLLTLGGSAGTRKGGVVGEVVVVRSREELDALGAKVAGKVVLFDHAMRDIPEHPHYGDVVGLRGAGPERASQLGAIGAMVRSLTVRSLRSPHTGSTRFGGARPIPAVALALEDADLIKRLIAAGDTVKVRLDLGARTLPDARSANVLGELVGREAPDEIVVIGAHLDSWDVGQGAHDDGAGVVACMQALTLLRTLGLTPRRTIRVVLWTNEEFGLRGASAYARAHQAELGRHVLAVEMDGGGFAPSGFSVQGDDAAVAIATDVAGLLAPIGVSWVRPGHAGADVGPLAERGVVAAGLYTDWKRYFDLHHTEADTLDKVSPDDLVLDVAALAVMAYVAAEMPGRFGGPAPAGR